MEADGRPSSSGVARAAWSRPNRGVMSPLSRGATLLDRDQDVIRAAGDHVSTLARTEMRSSGASWPLHPFLFGAAAVFSLYAANLRETTVGDVGAALGGVLVLALILLLGFGAALRRLGPRAAILASIVLIGDSTMRTSPSG